MKAKLANKIKKEVMRLHLIQIKFDSECEIFEISVFYICHHICELSINDVIISRGFEPPKN